MYFDFNSLKDDRYINQKFEVIYQIAKRTTILVESLVVNSKECINQFYKLHII